MDTSTRNLELFDSKTIVRFFPTDPNLKRCHYDQPYEFINGRWLFNSSIIESEISKLDAIGTTGITFCLKVSDVINHTEPVVVEVYLNDSLLEKCLKDTGDETFKITFPQEALKGNDVITFAMALQADTCCKTSEIVEFVVRDETKPYVAEYYVFESLSASYIIFAVHFANEELIKEIKWSIDGVRIREGQPIAGMRAVYFHLPWAPMTNAQGEPEYINPDDFGGYVGRKGKRNAFELIVEVEDHEGRSYKMRGNHWVFRNSFASEEEARKLYDPQTLVDRYTISRHWQNAVKAQEEKNVEEHHVQNNFSSYTQPRQPKSYFMLIPHATNVNAIEKL
ncbi:hypothetical protein [Ranid herpesvirus 3]|uniref:Uncharacterized protein n=1 Tax=Ranid herpesvirus 3 TaxID=1987509 RepID=A0A1X9T577_9VIRU|nr:hypothetical protein [Ranid herpesvirus 3]ARR28854.1 hypothetical protein [Ranid herpesvirus 3]